MHNFDILSLLKYLTGIIPCHLTILLILGSPQWKDKMDKKDKICCYLFAVHLTCAILQFLFGIKVFYYVKQKILDFFTKKEKPKKEEESPFQLAPAESNMFQSIGSEEGIAKVRTTRNGMELFHQIKGNSKDLQEAICEK